MLPLNCDVAFRARTSRLALKSWESCVLAIEGALCASFDFRTELKDIKPTHRYVELRFLPFNYLFL